MSWRWPLAGVGAVFVAAGGTWILPAAASTPATTQLGGYGSSAQALGFQVAQDDPSALVHPQAELDAGNATSTLNTGPDGYALSTVAWPGPLVGNLGTTLIVAGGAPSSASAADDPVRAEARTGSGSPTAQNNSVPGATMLAKATGSEVSATTSLAGAAVPGAVSAGKVATTSDTKLVTTTVSGTASSTLSDIAIDGGLIKIASFTSTADASANGATSTGRAGASSSVSGATVAGVPVTIDQSGVHAAGSGARTTAGNAAVNQALAGAGMSVFVAGPRKTVTGATASEQAGSVVFVWKPPQDPSSDSFTVALGGASVSVQATGGSGAALLAVAPPGVFGGQAPAIPLATAPTSYDALGATAALVQSAPALDLTLGPAARGTGPTEGAVFQPAGVLASLPLGLSSRPAWWTALCLIGALLAAMGLRRLPALVTGAGETCELNRSLSR
ncbi:MAG TPA: hypothetical protein VNF50_10220 [Acidimicrobiales bacterium]|nr:hypothetical protein [Acidimicrobiales bacterium]